LDGGYQALVQQDAKPFLYRLISLWVRVFQLHLAQETSQF